MSHPCFLTGKDIPGNNYPIKLATQVDHSTLGALMIDLRTECDSQELFPSVQSCLLEAYWTPHFIGELRSTDNDES